MIFCLLCIQNAQSAPNVVCVCHSTCYQIKSFISPAAFLSTGLANFPTVPLLYVLNVGFDRHVSIHTDALTHRRIKRQHSSAGHVHPECLPSCGLTSFFSSPLCSLFYQPPLWSSHSVFYYGIDSALFKCKQDLMSFHVCSCVVALRGWELSGHGGKSGQSPILLIILQYNGRHPQTWMTFIATLMIVREHSSSCVFVSAEAWMIY